MAQQTLNRAPPFSATDDNLPVATDKINANFSELYATTVGLLSSTVLAYTYPGSTIEAQIQNAINDAFARNIKRCFLSGTMVPFNAALVTFNPAVQMVWEYGPTDKWDVQAYGAVGDGITDDVYAINAADQGCAPGGTVIFGPGKTYAMTSLSAAHGLLAKNAGQWDLNGSTIKYTATTNVTTGSDGGAVPMVAVLRSPFTLRFGTLDGNSHAAWPLGIQGALTGPFLLEFIAIQNALEASSAWDGVAYTISADVSGVAISGARAQNVSGFLSRPSCPVINTAGTITGHANLSALLVGGSATWGNATGFAIVGGGGTETIQLIQTCGSAKGVLAFLGNSGAVMTNSTLLDLGCYDIGSRHQERYGAVLDVPQRQTFSSGGAYTPGWLDNTGGTDAIDHVITVSANVAVTINNPSNPAAISVDRVGRLRFVIRNTSGGGLSTAVTFTGAAYRVSGTVAPGNSQQIVVEVLWDQTNSTYIECFRSAAVAI